MSECAECHEERNELTGLLCYRCRSRWQEKEMQELREEIERLKEELERATTEWRETTTLYIDMVKRCDEARNAAREFAEYRPVPQDVRDNWLERFPWLGGSDE